MTTIILAIGWISAIAGAVIVGAVAVSAVGRWFCRREQSAVPELTGELLNPEDYA